MRAVPAIQPSNKSKDGTYVVYVRITNGQDRAFYNTGISVKKTWWNDKAREPDRKIKDVAPEANSHNITLRKLVGLAKDIWQEHLDRGELPTAVLIKNEIEKRERHGGFTLPITGTATDLFWPVADIYIAQHYRPGTRNATRSKLLQMRSFAPDLCFSHINTLFLTKYQSHLFELELNQNTVGQKISIIRTICNKAVEFGIIQFSPYKFKPPRRKKKPATYLTDNEIALYAAAKLAKVQDIARDVLLLGYYAHGIRVSDRIMLKWEQIEDNYIRLTARKNDEVKNIYIHARLAAILAKYGGGDGRFVFPLNQQDKNIDEVELTISRATGSINKSLKVVAKKLGIDKNISTHVARHTIANQLLRSNKSISFIAGVLAIDEDTAKTYAGRFSQTEMDKGMLDIYGE